MTAPERSNPKRSRGRRVRVVGAGLVAAAALLVTVAGPADAHWKGKCEPEKAALHVAFENAQSPWASFARGMAKIALHLEHAATRTCNQRGRRFSAERCQAAKDAIPYFWSVTEPLLEAQEQANYAPRFARYEQAKATVAACLAASNG